ncbi:MAG: MFS transporter [Lachnospiraceae bacterium]|jgi:OHS family lactose permease-like MFS transporter|nr:MFS transporter [Lachnospiraceae bacterium]
MQLKAIKRKRYSSYALLYFAYFFGMGIFNSILSIYLAGNGKADSEISVIISAGGIFTMLLQPVIGLVYDRMRRDRTISVALLCLSAICALLFASFQNNVLLFILNGLTTMFLSGVNPLCEQLATNTPYRYGLIRLWGAVGYAAATQAAAFIYETIAPRFNFYIFAAAMLVTMGAFFLTTNNDAAHELHATAVPKSAGILRVLLKNRSFLLFSFVSFLFSGAAAANGTYLTLRLQELLGNTTQVGSILFASTLMEIPIILFSNRYMNRLSAKQLLLISFGLLLIQFATYSLVSHLAALCLVLFLCKSTATMLYIMLTLKIILNLVEEGCTTTALSLIATFKSIGSAVIPIAAGLVSDSFGRPAVFVFLLLLSLIGFLCAAALHLPRQERALF